MEKKTYDRIANSAVVAVVLLAVLGDKYPAWLPVLTGLAVICAGASIFAYFKNEFERIDQESET